MYSTNQQNITENMFNEDNFSIAFTFTKSTESAFAKYMVQLRGSGTNSVCTDSSFSLALI